ncbi:hypothetical protein H7Q97_03745 [Ochrobactrum sp. CM-21-5]|nr:hypothetical protein [Ochrobactrum sp. CM-21-5]MBC2884514.1 hypothetical protein [Ochrobactrum sp. CM-21-5]
MTDQQKKSPGTGIQQDYDLDAAPQKVWRAISIPEFREAWLPKEALTDDEAASLTPGEEISYRMRENEPPFLESTVTFRIAPNTAGGTHLRVIHELSHELSDARLKRTTVTAANTNRRPVMRAA